MAFFLGRAGFVKLTRVAEQNFQSVIDPGDIDVAEKRFSFDFHNGTFISGDRLLISRRNPDGSLSNQPLTFVAAEGWYDKTPRPDGAWYVNVDHVGGLRLYKTWAAALSGLKSAAITLLDVTSSYPIAVELVNDTPQCMGQVMTFSLSSERQALDVSALGDAVANKTSGLISMSGSMRCLWDWTPAICEDAEQERSQYMHQLILRQQLGSEFDGEFVIKAQGERGVSSGPLVDTVDDLQISYEGRFLVTEAALEFSPTEPLISEISFVSAGEINLRMRSVDTGDLLQETGEYMLEEDKSKIPTAAGKTRS